MVGAGRFASRALKTTCRAVFARRGTQSSGPGCSNPPAYPWKIKTKTKAIPIIRYRFVGGSWWIRTTEALSSRFTVCPHWPLGKAPIFICASALTALDYYSRIRWKKQALFQKFNSQMQQLFAYIFVHFIAPQQSRQHSLFCWPPVITSILLHRL